ncbi:21 kDa protein-like [Prosopis cineraria]|uniref:21 kDa protein-like n=1 Tax=Prosopis cineraria TaxID=364024 RepID=UPI00240EBB0C|nr:21 kDa protein-like [Prosopis cineraria]
MAKPSVLSLLSLIAVISVSAAAAASASSTSNFIKTSCSTTTYPPLCLKSLSDYATTIQQDPYKLVQTALSFSLNKTVETRAFVSKLRSVSGLKPRDLTALRDCTEEMADSVDRLGRSLKELKLCKPKSEDFTRHMSNVETWVSSALTDESACRYGFAGKALNGRIKASIRARMVNVAHVTSNALFLINKYASGNY